MVDINRGDLNLFSKVGGTMMKWITRATILVVLMCVYCTGMPPSPKPAYLRVWIEGKGDIDSLNIKPGDCLNLGIYNIRMYRENGDYKMVYYTPDKWYDTTRIVNVLAWDTVENKFIAHYLGETDLPADKFVQIKLTMRPEALKETTFTLQIDTSYTLDTVVVIDTIISDTSYVIDTVTSETTLVIRDSIVYDTFYIDTTGMVVDTMLDTVIVSYPYTFRYHGYNYDIVGGVSSVAEAEFELNVEEGAYYDLYLYFDIENSVVRVLDHYELNPTIEVKEIKRR